MIAWPEEVVSSIARRRSVIFMGAGCSMTSVNAAGLSPPSWKAFLTAGIARCTGPKTELNRLLKNGDYLSCCQIIKYKLDQDWVPFVESNFLTPQFRPNELHRAIFSLDSSIVLTPNFDKIFDSYASTQNHNLLKIKKILRRGYSQSTSRHWPPAFNFESTRLHRHSRQADIHQRGLRRHPQ